jgi:hypothetical protein
MKINADESGMALPTLQIAKYITYLANTVMAWLNVFQ